MSGIEDLVRESLHERVAMAPALDDPAGRAVAGARTLRRRRALVVACFAGLAAVLATGALAGLRSGVHTLPLPPATVPPPGPASSSVSLVVDHHALLLPDGRSVTLPATESSMLGAVQLRRGWLVTGTTAGTTAQSLWLVTPDGVVHPLAQGLEGAPVVAADGLRFTWRTGVRLFTGHLADGGSLVVEASTPISGKGAPIALTDTAVVLGATATGGGIDSYDLWLPARGNYVPSWDVIAHVVAVYGALPGGRRVLGQVHPTSGSKAACLAELDPADSLRATRTACDLPLRVDPTGPVSRDGHWLAAPAGDGQVALIDLTTVFQRAAVTSTWHADRPGVWVDANTMVAPVSGGLRRFDTGGGAAPPVDVPGLPSGAQVDLVPRAES
jgi:hypothetical protein